ncbi:MAG: type IV pilin protein [Vicinamibacterales bacterium]
MRRRDSGFTLIEILIVITLIFILAGMALLQYQRSVTYAKEAVLKENLFRLRDAIDQFYADKNKYPASLDELVAEKYIRAVPPDPFTQSVETWQPVMSEADPLNPSVQPGIYDLKSGSEAMALDGTRYADWD